MKVRIDQDKCVGQAMCFLVCPEMFELSDEDGRATALREDVPQDLEEAVKQAERSCPERAITISD
jgi:ferredoxin